MEKNNDIEISIIKGDRLFNSNTPFVINLTTPESDENDKKSNADLICVIDVSSSMSGNKIVQVKESLETLINLIDKINEIDAFGGTSILSGLKIAINVIKKYCKNEKNVSSILLLSDGQDNDLDDIQLAESLKNITKGLRLTFTLNTFGYGMTTMPK